jgi:hypothetical protein
MAAGSRRRVCYDAKHRRAPIMTANVMDRYGRLKHHPAPEYEAIAPAQER